MIDHGDVAGNLIRLFVSSTFSDFQRERDLLQRRVYPALRALCAAQGFAFQLIDYRWGISEQAGQNQRALPLIFEEIARCQALSPELNFLLLMGDRYGSFLLPSTIPADEHIQIAAQLDHADLKLLQRWFRRDENAVDGHYVLLRPSDVDQDLGYASAKSLRQMLADASSLAGLVGPEAVKYTGSITHQEIHQGLLSQRDPSPVLALLRIFTRQLSGPLADAFSESDPRAQIQLRRLKGEIEGKLGDRILRYTAGWHDDKLELDEDAFVSAVTDELRSRLETIMVARSAGNRRAIGQVRQSANADFVERRTAFFIGRQRELETIAAYFADSTAEPLIFTGASGTGKSSLLGKAQAEARVSHPGVHLIARYVGVTPRITNVRDLLESIRNDPVLTAGKGREQQDAGAFSPMSFAADSLDTTSASLDLADLQNEVRALLADYAADQPVIVILDALDQLRDTPAAPLGLPLWIPQRLAPKVHLLLAVGDGWPVLTRWLQERPGTQVLTLGNLNGVEGQTLLQRWLEDAGRRLQPAQVARVFDAFAVDPRPLYLWLAFEEVRSWRSFDAPPELPPTLSGLLDRFFTRLERDEDHGRVVVSHALGLIDAARNGLSEQEMLDLLAADNDVREEIARLSPHSPQVEHDLPLPFVLWGRLAADLSGYLTESASERSTTITLYHQAIATHVRQRYLPQDMLRERHRALERYFLAQPARIERHYNERKLEEQVYQQAGALDWEGIRSTLTDLDFVEGRIATTGVASASADFALAPADDRLREIADSIRLGAHILATNPEQLENQIRGRVGTDEVDLEDTTGARDTGEVRAATAAEGLDVLGALHHSLPRVTPWLRLRSCSLAPIEERLMRVFQHPATVHRCLFSPDQSLLATLAEDSRVRIWDVETGILLTTFSVDALFAKYPWKHPFFAYGPDGRELLTASEQHDLVAYDALTGEEVRRLSGHHDEINDSAFSPDARLLLTASNDETLRIWDWETGRSLRTVEGHTDVVPLCAFSTDGQQLLSVSADGTVRKWDTETATQLASFSWDTLPTGGRLTAGCFSPDRSRFLCSSVTILVPVRTKLEEWDILQARSLQAYDDNAACCRYYTDSRYAIFANHQDIYLLDIETGQFAANFDGHGDDVKDCMFSRDGRLLISAAADATARFWRVLPSHGRYKRQAHHDQVRACRLNTAGTQGLSGADDTTIMLWDRASTRAVRTLTGHEAAVLACAFSPDGQHVFSAGIDGTLHTWSVADGTRERTYSLNPEYIVVDCTYFADGQRILLALHVLNSINNVLLTFDLSNGQPLGACYGHRGFVTAAALHPNQRRALSASASTDRTLRLWDLDTGKTVRVFKGHTDNVTACAFSPDGGRILSGSDDRTVRLWDTQTGRTLQILRGHTESVSSCSFVPGGRVVTGGADHTVRLWDLATSTELARWVGDYGVMCLACSAQGDVIVGDTFGNVHFLSIDDPRRMG